MSGMLLGHSVRYRTPEEEEARTQVETGEACHTQLREQVHCTHLAVITYLIS